MTATQTTQDEVSLIKSYLLLTRILKAFENDAKKLESDAPMQTSTLYTEMIRQASRCAATLLSGIRSEFKKSQIRVCEVTHSEQGVDADYLCRGLHGTLHIDDQPFHQEMNLRMRAYMGLFTTDDRSAEPIVTDSGSASFVPARRYASHKSYLQNTRSSAKKNTQRSFPAGTYA